MPSANKAIIPFRKRIVPRRNEYELAFLPAALEIVETPPSPIGRLMGALIIAVFCIALAWASFGYVDIVATASGKIVPSGRTKMVQPFETGVVRAIRVRDGQTVKAGDVLIELDPTMTEAELAHAESDRLAASLDIARLRAMLAGHADPVADFEPPAGASQHQIDMHRRFLISQFSEQKAKLAQIDRELSQKEAEGATISAIIKKIEAMIPVLQERVGVRKYLYDKELGSKITYLTDYQELISQQQDLNIQKSKLQETEAALEALKENRARTEAEFRRGLFDELAKAEQKAAALTQDVLKAEHRTKLQLLSAPVDGNVQQLAVHTIGGVVTPAQVLAVVVPLDSQLEIEAMVPNRDIGFVHSGQDVSIKIDTFNFTKYGLLHGKVLSVSQDAITREKPLDASKDKTQGTDAGSSEPKGQELVYAARISLDRKQMQVEDKHVNLAPGMAVTAEIKTGSRKIISYLLSPLLRYKQEMFRER
jgi:membrane fusion protein, hemolysin D